MPPRRRAHPRIPLSRKLILNHWVLGLFGCDRFEDLAQHLRDEALEGLDDDGVHHFHRAIRMHVPANRRPELPDDLLLHYDENITSITRELNEARLSANKALISWKYFQYLALLFAEIYLDRFFDGPRSLLTALNESVRSFNARTPGTRERIKEFDLSADPRTQLNKLAFWMATGSGKTLLMHANIRQYQRLLRRHGLTRNLNRIILLTPDPGLSLQHFNELNASGISSDVFKKGHGTMLSGQVVEILNIHKLKSEEEEGPTTVAAAAFEGNNLVLVDEGHRGASSGKRGRWMQFRNQLCEGGFSFEYSATFGQAVRRDRMLTDTYAQSTLFDYSYQRFYRDGFGKDYRIFNLDRDADDDSREMYLTACLLMFFLQQWRYGSHERRLRRFNIEPPLWIFVGGRVTKGLSKADASDVSDILRFLKSYASEDQASKSRIERLVAHGLATAGGHSLFKDDLAPLDEAGYSAREIHNMTLKSVFNAPYGGMLRIERLNDSSGELALRLGDSPPFGVVNVGDSLKLKNHLQDRGMGVIDRTFAGSLFDDINRPDSRVNLLVGARKFTEGWNSWRVSTMGLMNVGKSEGAQIIQLFGRGVRLKGRKMSLKRSSALRGSREVGTPGLKLLETLQVFGVRAKYMAQFRDFLEEERLATEQIERILPIVPRTLPRQGLKTIRLATSVASGNPQTAFRRLGPLPQLCSPDELSVDLRDNLRRSPIDVDWYPKIRVMKSEGAAGGDLVTRPEHGRLKKRHIEWLDVDRLLVDLHQFKAERGWHNFSVSRGAIQGVLADSEWYRIRIPRAALCFNDYSNVRQWQEIALTLLKKYMSRFYSYCRQHWEAQHLEYRDLTLEDANFPVVTEDTDAHGYRVLIDGSNYEQAEKTAEAIDRMAEALMRPDFTEQAFGSIKAMSFEQHLYRPLLRAGEQSVSVSPVPLNDGEWNFVCDLRDYCKQYRETLHGFSIHLIRNMSRGRGIGFFEAANFHPDFILWVVNGRRQRIVFVDPKGLGWFRPGHPKIQFHETIKKIETRLNDPNVTLDSFIVSTTPYQRVQAQWGMDRSQLADCNVLFQEDRLKCIQLMLDKIGLPQPG